jgi:flagellar protein FlaG
MTNPLSAISSVQSSVSAEALASRPKSRPPTPSVESAPDLRLVIEEGPRRGSFVYKTVDRLTGETVRQFPREELVKMSETPDYVAGVVANTRA